MSSKPPSTTSSKPVDSPAASCSTVASTRSRSSRGWRPGASPPSFPCVSARASGRSGSAGRRAYVTEHTLRDSKGEDPPLSLTVHVVVRYQRGRKWGKHGCQYLIFAVLGEIPLPETDPIYRRRFGIETSYRIVGQALARTSSRRPALRLLHVGVAAMLQNEWVVLKLLWASEGRQGRKGFVIVEELLRFEDLLNHLARAIGTGWEKGERWSDIESYHGGSGGSKELPRDPGSRQWGRCQVLESESNGRKSRLCP